MALQCRFSGCQWSGPEDEIFYHFEAKHKKFLRDPKGLVYFDLTLEDLQQEAFVLCCPTGLYWFRQNLARARSDGFDFGIFHIGESEPVECTLKLGLKQDGHCEYWGAHTSNPDGKLNADDTVTYNFKFDFEHLKVMTESMPSQRVRLYFGEFDDSDDKIWPDPQDIIWTEQDELLMRSCIEQFTCPVCFEYIRRDVRFCENTHFICLKCFERIRQDRKLECPICRGAYLYDCMDVDLERILRMIKWPDMEEIDVDPEIEKHLKYLPNVEHVEVRGEEILPCLKKTCKTDTNVSI